MQELVFILKFFLMEVMKSWNCLKELKIKVLEQKNATQMKKSFPDVLSDWEIFAIWGDFSEELLLLNWIYLLKKPKCNSNSSYLSKLGFRSFSLKH